MFKACLKAYLHYVWRHLTALFEECTIYNIFEYMFIQSYIYSKLIQIDENSNDGPVAYQIMWLAQRAPPSDTETYLIPYFCRRLVDMYN